MGGGFESVFVEQEATPQPLINLGIHLHVAGSSLSDTFSVLDAFGGKRRGFTHYKWIRRADLQPRDGRFPNHNGVYVINKWIRHPTQGILIYQF